MYTVLWNGQVVAHSVSMHSIPFIECGAGSLQEDSRVFKCRFIILELKLFLSLFMLKANWQNLRKECDLLLRYST